MKIYVLSNIIATGFDSHNNEHPAAFLPPPPPSFTGHSTTSHWLNIWMEKDGCLVKKASTKTRSESEKDRHAFRKGCWAILLGLNGNCKGLGDSLDPSCDLRQHMDVISLSLWKSPKAYFCSILLYNNAF